MKPFWAKLITQTVLRKRKTPAEQYTAFMLAKGLRELRITVWHWIKDVLLIALGVGSAAFGLEGFIIPNNFTDGGATGMALLSAEVAGLPLSVLLLVINAPFVLLGYQVIGRLFAIKTAVAIAALALVVGTVHFPEVTHDKLLAAVFGGFFLGAGIGLSVRGGAVIDGTEVLAIFISRKAGVTIGDVIIVINVFIFSAAAYLLSIEIALYSMITYLAASKTLDFVIEGIEEYTGVTIVSTHSDEIREMIINDMGRGVTVYVGKRGYGKQGHTTNTDIIYSVITRLEISKLNAEIQKIDPHAFIVMNSVKDTRGGMVKKRPLAH